MSRERALLLGGVACIPILWNWMRLEDPSSAGRAAILVLLALAPAAVMEQRLTFSGGRNEPARQVGGRGGGTGDRGRDSIPRPARPALPRPGVGSVLERLSRVLRRQAALRAGAASSHGRRDPDRGVHLQRGGRAGRLRTATR